MKAKGGSFTLYGVFLCLLHISLFRESGAVPTLKVEEVCMGHNSAYVEGYDSAILEATRNTFLDCEITLKATRLSVVIVSFDQYTIKGNDTLEFKDYDGNHVSLMGIRDGKSFIFNGPVTIHYVANMDWTNFSSFRILYTITNKFCMNGQFKCKNSICIKNSLVCDGNNNCGDMSDETDCSDKCTSVENEFRCSNNRCIPKYKLCDGRNDCGDGSDEKDCWDSCTSKEFKCVSKKCIPQYRVCDGHNDCGDRSDETNCYQTCDFRCSNNKCIKRTQRCNGEDDCGDRSDESNCSSRRETQQEEVMIRGGLILPSIFSVIAIGLVGIFTIVFGVCFCVLMKKKADKQPTDNTTSELQQPAPSSMMGRLRQSFRSLGRPTAPPLEMVSATESASPEYQQTPSVVGRIRNSFRSNRHPTAHPTNTTTTSNLSSGNSAMYPRLATAGDLPGVDNPEFKVEE